MDLLPYPVKRAVHLGARSYRRLTSPARVLPSFLICGGQRCGATWLYRALAAHPTVLTPTPHPGVHYFDNGYHRGIGWYRAHFPLRRAARRVRAEYGVPAQAFESTPYYLYHPHAPARIGDDLPWVRLIVLVRDPVERAYAQFAYARARGWEPEDSFARALESEPERLRGHHDRLARDPFAYSFAHQHRAYRAHGEYVRYLEAFASYVDRRRILVVDSGLCFTDPAAVYGSVLDFLRLPRLGEPPRRPRTPRPAPIPEPLRRELAEYYAPWDERLADWLGAPVSWRRQPMSLAGSAEPATWRRT